MTPLPGGLTLRHSTRGDADRLAEFHAAVFSEPPVIGPDPNLAAWVLNLLTSGHPTFGEDDFLLVEDAGGKIVSSSCWISQTWTFDGIAFKVGRPEVVATDPAYRRRGLIAAQFAEWHAVSAARGELVQGITGIPYYYRQFGYEMALDLGGGPSIRAVDMPQLKDGEGAGHPERSETKSKDAPAPEPFRVRPATPADAPLFARLDQLAARRALIYCPRDEALWRYEIGGRRADAVDRLLCRVVETPDGAPVGGFAAALNMQGNHGLVPFMELLPGVSWIAAADTLLRASWAAAELAAALLVNRRLDALQFGLGPDHACAPAHPFYRVNSGRFMPSGRPWAWYIRVPDLKAFLRLIAPALEARLINSAAAHYTGDLLISFYRSGLRLHFERGALTDIADWPPNDHDAHAKFPDLTFTHLLFGHRTIDELRHIFTDVTLDDRIGRPLIEALFPRRPSSFWALV